MIGIFQYQGDINRNESDIVFFLEELLVFGIIKYWIRKRKNGQAGESKASLIDERPVLSLIAPDAALPIKVRHPAVRNKII
ncbi:hypothetical protein ACD591_05755 [Rufibacter glacialis]|uniref:Uncharacterized protein n=1 Tax=Rufibacter glacialis TaxID=1259555 RepID=A0A5M8QEJ1_9BACT|nr:hypothetical protein [Rufibacter glacialis]KAA6433166.1 hypothetical protein FOE74_11805 [Rufibacter glacialis]GGK76834.1 hypothetical protein GCM10011405_25790 [Rufibacter glacialis]